MQVNFPEQRRAQAGPLTDYIAMRSLPYGSISGLLRKRATANPFTRASCYSWSSNWRTSTTCWQKLRSVPHFLQPPAIDKERESNAKKYVNQRRDEMARTWKHILRHEHFRAKIPVRGRFFFERRFQPLSVGGFFSNQRESNSRCPKSLFPSKTQNQQIARTSPLTTCILITGGWVVTSFHQSVCCYREWLAATCGLLSYTSQTGRHYD